MNFMNFKKLYELTITLLKETRNSFKMRTLDFEKNDFSEI